MSQTVKSVVLAVRKLVYILPISRDKNIWCNETNCKRQASWVVIGHRNLFYVCPTHLSRACMREAFSQVDVPAQIL